MLGFGPSDGGELTPEVLAGTANVAIKYDRDLWRTLQVLPGLVDPNAEVPDHGHPHGHDHGPGHSHGPGADHDHGPADPDPAGQAVRAAKDSEGRHDQDYYGAPGRTALVKDRRDEGTFDWVFDRFFRLLAVAPAAEPGPGHAHDDLSDGGVLDTFTLSETPAATPQQDHSHGAPDDIAQYFDPADLAAQYNLHQEANRIDLAALTDEIVLSTDSPGDAAGAARVELSTARLHNPGRPGDPASGGGLKLDTELTVAQEAALLSWLAAQPDDDGVTGLAPDELAALRTRLSGLIEKLPAAPQRHLEALLAGGLVRARPEGVPGRVRVGPEPPDHAGHLRRRPRQRAGPQLRRVRRAHPGGPGRPAG